VFFVHVEVPDFRQLNVSSWLISDVLQVGNRTPTELRDALRSSRLLDEHKLLFEIRIPKQIVLNLKLLLVLR
jgi:hypothetical protein